MYLLRGEFMGNQEQENIDIEDLLKESLSDTKITEENEDLVLEYLCKTITANDSKEDLKILLTELWEVPLHETLDLYDKLTNDRTRFNKFGE